MKTQTKKLDIVREVIEIINQCKADKMEMCISMEVCLYLKDTYGYNRAEASLLLVGAELIDELGLLND